MMEERKGEGEEMDLVKTPVAVKASDLSLIQQADMDVLVMGQFPVTLHLASHTVADLAKKLQFLAGVEVFQPPDRTPPVVAAVAGAPAQAGGGAPDPKDGPGDAVLLPSGVIVWQGTEYPKAKLCDKHGGDPMQRRWSQKYSKFFYSHKGPDGSWCNMDA